jgi:hypothetical protein
MKNLDFSDAKFATAFKRKTGRPPTTQEADAGFAEFESYWTI